jgi:hypothetical protein
MEPSCARQRRNRPVLVIAFNEFATGRLRDGQVPRAPLSAIYENGSPVKAHLVLLRFSSRDGRGSQALVFGDASPFSATLLLKHTLAPRAPLGCCRKIPLSIYPRTQAHDVQRNRRRMRRRGWGVPINKRFSRPWQRSGTPPTGSLAAALVAGPGAISAWSASTPFAAPPRALDRETSGS